ncbi:MAG TPA: cation diffusion facilitator family transporter [Solirubrobacteraceae bacterium]|nr:cation diffusion facilitator family transporter [Solirubrobacteraceae bacterium]
MAHDHHHAHGHHHRPPVGAGSRRLAIALGLILALMAGEVVVGLLADSLALLSDAAHMLTDAAALAIALVAARVARRPAKGQMTFGLGRAEALAAQFNGATLLVLGVVIVIGAVGRLFDPPGVDAGPVLAVALVGVAVNIVATWVVSGADRRSLNVEGAYQHLLTDLAAFAFTAIAAVVILATGFHEADAIAALLVAAIMLRAAWSLLRASARVFLEAAPDDLDVDAVGHAMAAHAGVVEVHDLHVWELGTGFTALSAHVLVAEGDDCHAIRASLEQVLHEQYAIEHTTLQVDHEHLELLTIESG